MRYWPMSQIAERMTGPHAVEVQQMCKRPCSPAAFHKCFEVAKRTAALPIHGLLFIESTDASVRQVFSEYPSWHDWFRLERAAVLEKNGFYFIVIDTLH